MKIPKVVWKETVHIGLGTLIGCVIMNVVFVILKKWNYTVLLGSFLGCVVATGNFFFMGISLQKALTKGDLVQKYMRASFNLRMMTFAACAAIGLLVPVFHPVATIVPLFFPQPVIYIMRAFGYRPEENEHSSEGGVVD